MNVIGLNEAITELVHFNIHHICKNDAAKCHDTVDPVKADIEYL